MARLPERFIHRVAEATDIVDVIGQYVALKKRGREFVGLCPFHEDHRPSLNVSPTKQIYKCFACGAGGGVFQFLMQLQGLSFPEAVRHLAERAGIPLPAEPRAEGADSSLSTETLVRVNTFAARFFRDLLGSPAGASALAYARQRGLKDESVRRFGLGYAPDSATALRAAALQAGFTDRQLLAAGLTARREDGSVYDRFRNRLMFPILDPGGQVIAFGGRALSATERAKYLNSPQTALFDKSANLYALNWSRPAIVEAGQAVVVEGYLDALMCIQEGVPNVTATLGTALTERHVRLLGRFAREVVLVFDADTAGQAAAERAVEVFVSQRLHVRVAAVPAQASSDGAGEVKDPCDYVLAAGPEAFRSLLASASDALEYAWSRRVEEYRRAPNLVEKGRILEQFLRLVVSSSAYGSIDALRQGLLAAQIAELAGVSPADVAERMRRMARRIPRASAAPAEAQPDLPGGEYRAEGWLLGALVNAPELFETVQERVSPEMFREPTLRAVAERVWELGRAGRLDISTLLNSEQGQAWGGVLTDLQLSAQQRGNYEQTLADAAEDLCRRRRQEELQHLKAQGDRASPEVLSRIAQLGRRTDRRRRPKLP